MFFFFFLHKKIISAGKCLLVVGCHIILRGFWFDGFVLHVHASADDKTDDMKDRIYAHYRQLNVDQWQI